MLETIILSGQMKLNLAFKATIGMYFVLVAMESAMNMTDLMLTVGAILKW